MVKSCGVVCVRNIWLRVSKVRQGSRTVCALIVVGWRRDGRRTVVRRFTHTSNAPRETGLMSSCPSGASFIAARSLLGAAVGLHVFAGTGGVGRAENSLPREGKRFKLHCLSALAPGSYNRARRSEYRMLSRPVIMRDRCRVRVRVVFRTGLFSWKSCSPFV